MPTRLIREGILSSEAVCSLNWAAEVFYRRLMSVVDDYGRFSASSKLLRSACYPLQIDKVSDSDIEKWLSACETAALVRVYPAADGKRYVELQKFGQQVRSKSKCPPPLEVDAPLQAPDNNCYQEKADVHLCGGGCEGVSEVVFDKQQQQRARNSDDKFPMNANWQPSENMQTIGRLAGTREPTSEDTGEFVAYWLGHPEMLRTQHQWEHAFAKSLKATAVRPEPRKAPRAKATTKSFAERDAEVEIEKWEQMTGRVHPSRQQHSAPLDAIEATTKLIGAAA